MRHCDPQVGVQSQHCLTKPLPDRVGILDLLVQKHPYLLHLDSFLRGMANTTDAQSLVPAIDPGFVSYILPSNPV
jgi:hypothetical protein